MARRARQHPSTLKPLNEMIEETIAFIQSLPEAPNGLFVGFSGGKDSQVLLDLVQRSGRQHIAGYSVTGIDPPELVQFIKQHYPSVLWLRPKTSFWEGIRKKGPPRKFVRWCCDILKKEPAERYARLYPIQLVGVRAEESIKRAKYPIFDPRGKRKIARPILHWTDWHVWEYIEQQNLPYCSLYDEGWDRIGCVVCPFITSKTKTRLDRAKARWPGLYKVFEKVVRDWFETNQKCRTGFHVGETVEEYLEE